ncbi:Pectinesterase inhibitor-like [Heracleum sosnowskyi]|uniref:Pectinesterase inhibitor-like n=1 Tax=Heracleum sosnowskyi TaxID=360622 RepID=A0AAD8I9X2_9APIA|nr:Pectinesterase inhibitor-like [Heracleum sosnowskyi]
MASIMYQNLTVACLAIAMLGLFASTTEAKAVSVNQKVGLNRFCRTSDYKRVCNTMVKDAKNWHDATRNAIQSSLQVATGLQGMSPLLDSALARVSANSKASTTITCKETFDDTVDSLKQCLKFLDNNDTGSLNAHLSAAVHISDCQDAFEEFGASLPPRVSKTAEILSRQVSNCLAVSEQT